MRADGVGGRKEGKSVAERVLGVEVPRVVNYEGKCPKIWRRGQVEEVRLMFVDFH